jgi:hypothetical protein
MNKRRATMLPALSALAFLLVGAPQQLESQTYTVNVTTAHQDIPAICSGCVYRTGQNLQEGMITNNITKNTFGQYCYYNLDGQVFGQPLVVTNVTMQADNTNHHVVVYVVTMNGSVYAFDGTPSAPSGAPGTCMNGQTAGPIAQINLLSRLSSGTTAASCANLGAGNCLTIAPNVGILGTPVISANTNNNPTTGTLYVVLESQVTNGGSMTFSHTLFALDITSLGPTVSLPISVPSTCPIGNIAPFSQIHIQRPALLLGGDGYLYVAFSMMDGNTNPYPNGMMLAYNTVNLTSTTTPLCLAMSQGIHFADGAGIWGGSGGPSYGTDRAGGTDFYTYFNTANGVFDLNNQGGSNAGDTFVKMSNSGSALSIADYFTPGDQYWRSNKFSVHAGCSADGDVDLGSGNPMLVPDVEDASHSYLAVFGDKEGGIWFVDRGSPGKGGTTATCTGSPNTNLQTYPINGSSYALKTGPLIHTNPAFWETDGGTNYLFLGSSSVFSLAGAGELMRYQICNTGLPISASSNPPCSTQGVAAYENGAAVVFPWGTTPSISAASRSEIDAIVWAIWADGSVVPTLGFVPPGPSASSPGKLYAFDAASSTSNMPKLYSSEDCVIGGNNVDRINPATKYSVPTVADGHVYLGTQGPLLTVAQCGSLSASCFNNGTFYIFGNLTRSTCS